ncbi:uroporphyrinogen-III C-methyltransferase [Alteromonas mediterranea]|jgi:uroporphyrin-3 C-methyltransferase|uniref:Heme biosynthesis operon protein HemX n=1 Tax=Alteromonas mediterranea TaxID=314275 RepID=A0AAC9F6I7_9ALTE|nr:uroporphyrinogen-III C-methyltransferase [Alteromonas mediterranea]AFV83667.1 putative uroporphyrin-III C-methyltransferase [Alteromonas mediterranea DE1]AGP95681.1 uroporphyrin-III C-methyltransferase [Alteromonas mediterranea UM7]AGQ00012.1 uroporphyrin-III C-methyltransferase [Alteromonas mediterranea UM4b]AMJ76928.1 heme biosynthesis operon protein HemX [Alteromonas mediterranea]AMJ81073.1 heme biosynthesis operon protein HemX [Alteromonas mediterranea]
MANNNENSPHKEELVKVDAEKEVIESSATQSESSKSGAKQKKSSGNGLLWFVVIILFLLVLGMAGAGYWYYMQQQSASQETVIAQQNNASQLKAIERERADILASIENVTRTNQTLESTVAELKSQNEQLALQAESTLQQLNNMEGRRPADWLIAEADYLVRMAGRKLWLENDVRTAILLLVNADKRLKSLADPSVLPVRATLAEDIQTLQQLNPVSQSSVALALTGMMAQIDKLPLDTFEKPEDSNAQDTTLSESADDWQENLAKVWRSLVDDFLTVKSIEGPVEPVLSLEAQFLAKEQLRLQLMHAQTAALQGDEGLYSQSLQYAQTLLTEKFDTEKSQVTGFMDALQNLIATDVARPIPTELASQKPLERLLDSRVKQVFGQGASAL